MDETQGVALLRERPAFRTHIQAGSRVVCLQNMKGRVDEYKICKIERWPGSRLIFDLVVEVHFYWYSSRYLTWH